MCGATTKRTAEEVGLSETLPKQAKRFGWNDILEHSLGFVDATTLVHASRTCKSLKYSSNNAARGLVLGLVEFFVANGDVEFTHGIACKRADVETWCGLLYSLQYEPHEVTLSAYVAESDHSGEDIRTMKQQISESAGLERTCKKYNFRELFRPDHKSVGERVICPYDSLPAHMFTFTSHSVSVVQASKFSGALRATLNRKVKVGALARCRVDGWGSWRLTPLLRYENYFDFDADTPYRFHLSVPPYHCLSSKWVISSPLKNRPSKRRSLVLDLDETLIHTEVEPIVDADFRFTLSSNEGSQTMFVRIRPHAKHFLAEVSKHFEVIVFTASERPYAEHILKHLDPSGTMVEHVLCREDCTFIEGEFVKDLGSLKRDLSDVVLVDNRPEMYCYHADNGIPISSWFEDRRDCELLRLMPSLARLTSHSLSDVRSYVRHHWRTFEHVRRVGAHLSDLVCEVTQDSHQKQEGSVELDSHIASFDLQTPDWLGNDLSTGGEDLGSDHIYYNEESKNNLFSIGTCSRTLNNHFYFNENE